MILFNKRNGNSNFKLGKHIISIGFPSQDYKSLLIVNRVIVIVNYLLVVFLCQIYVGNFRLLQIYPNWAKSRSQMLDNQVTWTILLGFLHLWGSIRIHAKSAISFSKLRMDFCSSSILRNAFTYEDNLLVIYKGNYEKNSESEQHVVYIRRYSPYFWKQSFFSNLMKFRQIIALIF